MFAEANGKTIKRIDRLNEPESQGIAIQCTDGTILFLRFSQRIEYTQELFTVKRGNLYPLRRKRRK